MKVDRVDSEYTIIIVDEIEAQMLSDTIEDAINHVGYPPNIRRQLEKLSKDLICSIGNRE